MSTTLLIDDLAQAGPSERRVRSAMFQNEGGLEVTGKRQRSRVAATLVAVVLALSTHAHATDDAASFYAGKTIKIIVGFGPGGGYDLYARFLAQHLGNNIPGKPSVIVENMEGAGSVRAANYVYVVAPKDGTVIAAVNQNASLYQLLGGQGAQYHSVNFNWIGGMVVSNEVLYTWHTSGVSTIDDAKKREVILGGVARTSDSYIYPTLINEVARTRFKVVTGYPGSNEINFAVERGEVMGRGGNSWASVVTNRRSWIDEKKINILVQIGSKKEPDIPDVPLLSDMVSNAEDKQLIDVVTLPLAVGYAYWLPPGVPVERIEILRAAFDKVVKDQDMLGEAARRGIIVRPQAGVRIQAYVKDAAATPPAALDRAARMLDWVK